jgi:hypothetical protein
MAKPLIKPTIGRVVWYYPDGDTGGDDQPLAAVIAHVWDDYTINLMAIDPNGNTFSVLEAVLLQGDEVPHPGESYACWMPYQLGQAGKVLEMVQPSPSTGM